MLPSWSSDPTGLGEDRDWRGWPGRGDGEAWLSEGQSRLPAEALRLLVGRREIPPAPSGASRARQSAIVPAYSKCEQSRATHIQPRGGVWKRKEGKGKGKGKEEGRESPGSKSGLRYSPLLAPRTPSGLPRSTRPGLRSRAPGSAPPLAPNLHRLTLRGSDCPPYSDSGDGRADSVPGPGAGVWRPGACSTLALGLRQRASSPIPLLVPRAATRRGEKRGQSGQLRPQPSRAGYGGC